VIYFTYSRHRSHLALKQGAPLAGRR